MLGVESCPPPSAQPALPCCLPPTRARRPSLPITRTADEFFAKQLPHNVTWFLTLLYALDQPGGWAGGWAGGWVGACTALQGALAPDPALAAACPTPLPPSPAPRVPPPPAGDFGDTATQGVLVHDMRYLASIVTQCFTAFGELLAMPKRFAELSGGAGCVCVGGGGGVTGGWSSARGRSA